MEKGKHFDNNKHSITARADMVNQEWFIHGKWNQVDISTRFNAQEKYVKCSYVEWSYVEWNCVEWSHVESQNPNCNKTLIAIYYLSLENAHIPGQKCLIGLKHHRGTRNNGQRPRSTNVNGMSGFIVNGVNLRQYIERKDKIRVPDETNARWSWCIAKVSHNTLICTKA